MRQSFRACARWLVIGLFLGSVYALPAASAYAEPRGWGSSSSEGPSPLCDPYCYGYPIGWGTPFPVDYIYRYISAGPRVAVDTGGNAISVWAQYEGQRSNVYASRYTENWGWSTAQVIETDDRGSAYGPEVAVAKDGDAAVVWSQYDGLRNSIWANLYTVGGVWGIAAHVEANDTEDAYEPQVAIDASQNVIVAWVQSDGIRSSVWANRYSFGTGWGAPTAIEASDEYAYAPQLAIDGSGNAIIVWAQNDGPRTRLFANRYAFGAGWGTPALVSTNDTGSAYGGKVAVDPNGNAIVVWSQYDGVRDNIFGNRYTVGAGWTTATLIETNDAGSANQPDIAIDANGNAIAVWSQSDGLRDSIWANRYSVGTGWGTATLIEDDDRTGAWGPRVATDPAGDALVVWQQHDGVQNSIFANRYSAVKGWQTATPVENDDQGYASVPEVAVDPNGNALVVWAHSEWSAWENRVSVGANRYVAGKGWDGATRIRSQDVRSSGSPHIATNARGDLAIVWETWDGTRSNIFATGYPECSDCPTLIETSDENAYGPRVAIDADGDVIAVWSQYDGVRSNIWANRYTVGTGWGTARLIEDSNRDLGHVQLAIDPDGNALVVWHQAKFVGSATEIWSNRYEVGIGWGTATLLESTRASTFDPTVVIDSDGNAIAVWVEDDGTRTNIRSSRYTTGFGWGTSTAIEDTRVPAWFPQVAVDPSGSAIAIWQQSTDSRTGVWANRYTAGVGWGSATPIDAEVEGYASDLRIAVDPTGNAIAVWVLQDELGRTRVQTNRYTMGSGWESPIQVPAPDSYASTPQIAIDGEGNGTAVWTGYDGVTYNIYANRYVASAGWGTATSIEREEGGAWSPHLVADEEGRVTAVWSQYDGTRSRIWRTQYAPRRMPLLLALTNPVDGAILDVPTVVVAGSTESGATVVVNGIQTVVSPNGSFSLPLALSEGLNAITAVARDEFGTVTIASVRVTYRNRVPVLEDDLRDTSDALADTQAALRRADAELATLRGNILLLIVVQAAVATATVALFALYWNLRRKPPGGSGERPHAPTPSEPLATESTGGKSSLAGEAKPRSRVEDHKPWNGWAVAGGPLRLTAKERILLHLLNYARFTEAAEVPPDLAQAGIAAMAGVDSRHFAQYIRPLVRAAFVRERTAHVKGVLQRRKVYVLTEAGRRTALGVRDRLRSATVKVRDGSETREATIADVLEKSGGKLSILDLVRETVQFGVVGLKP